MTQQLVLENATVRTLDPATPVVRELAVRGSEISARPEPGAPRIDLGGACVLPGLNDSHVHFPTWSLAQRQVRLEDASTRAEALERVALSLAEVPAGGWLRGYGWRDGNWAEPPDRAALDRVAGEVPVALMAKDYHSLWLNGAALARADAPLDVPGGIVERDEYGEPLGILRENAAWGFRDRYLIPSQDEMVEASRLGLAIAASRGVTAVHDKDGWMGAFETFARLQENGELTLRVWQSLPADRLSLLRELGLRSGFGNEWLRLGYLKVFMDGTLGSATAHLLDGSGVEITSSGRLAEIVREAAAAGWPVGVHAIGDAANRAALDAFEATADTWRPLGLRQRIEHAQLLDPADLGRFAALLVSVFLPGGVDLLDTLVPLHDYGRYADLHPKLKVAGVPLPGTPFGLHPSLARGVGGGIKGLFERGKVGFMPGIDYGNPDLSHFHSRHFWETGLITDRAAPGWLGRMLDRSGGSDNPLQGVSMGYGLSPVMRSSGAPVAAVASPGNADFWFRGVWGEAQTEAIAAYGRLGHGKGGGRALEASRTAAHLAKVVADRLEPYAEKDGVDPLASTDRLPGGERLRRAPALPGGDDPEAARDSRGRREGRWRLRYPRRPGGAG